MDYDSGILCVVVLTGVLLFYLIPQMALYYSLLLVATLWRAAMAKFKSDLSQMAAGIISVFIWFCSFTVAICVSYQSSSTYYLKITNLTVPLPIFWDFFKFQLLFISLCGYAYWKTEK
jgi:hypothetical protein